MVGRYAYAIDLICSGHCAQPRPYNFRQYWQYWQSSLILISPVVDSLSRTFIRSGRLRPSSDRPGMLPSPTANDDLCITVALLLPTAVSERYDTELPPRFEPEMYGAKALRPVELPKALRGMSCTELTFVAEFCGHSVLSESWEPALEPLYWLQQPALNLLDRTF